MEEDGGLGREKRNLSMKYSKEDGMAYSVMAGVGDAYLPAAVIALGASNFYVGLLAALPQLVGAALQFAALSALRVAKDRKLLVIAGALAQALCWLPIIALMLWPGELSIPLIILFFSLGAGISLMVNPVWSSWISDIVPDNERASFFADRNRLMQAVLFVTTFSAGLLLRQLQLGLPAAAAFAIVFSVPFFSRLLTVFFHARTERVEYGLQLIREIKLKHLFLLPSYRHELWFLVFMAMVNFSVQFAAPFFTPYMLSGLRFDIGMLGMMTAASVLAKIVSYPYWGKAIDRFGNRAVLVSASFATALVPVLWLATPDFWWLMCFQVFSGFAWSGLDLSSFNFALSMVGRELRPSFISKYNAFNGFFYAAGSLAGGLFLTGFSGARLLGFSGIMLVFLISGAMRLAVALFFAPKLSSSREVENTHDERAVIVGLVTVYPTMGAVQQVVGGWDFTRRIVASGAEKGGRAISGGIEATGETLAKGGRKLASAIIRKKHL